MSKCVLNSCITTTQQDHINIEASHPYSITIDADIPSGY